MLASVTFSSMPLFVSGRDVNFDRMSQDGDQQPSCSRKMRSDGSPRVSPSRPTFWAKLGDVTIPRADNDAALWWSTAMEKHELSASDFKLIDDAFKALLQSNPEPVTADKIKDLRNMFHDAYTGWLAIDEAA